LWNPFLIREVFSTGCRRGRTNRIVPIPLYFKYLINYINDRPIGMNFQLVEVQNDVEPGPVHFLPARKKVYVMTLKLRRMIFATGLMLFGLVAASPQNELNDREIADAIETECRFDHAINVNHLDVEVLNGIATLKGTVNNLQARNRATKIAELVKGVRSVSNQITVDPPVVLSDEGIEENIRHALMSDPATDSYEVWVESNNKLVTLTGTVDSYQEKELCEVVASSVKGVVDLKNEIDVRYEMERPDAEIRAEIKQALKWDVLVDDGLINVMVNDGQVTLSGIVGSAAEKTNAFYTAWVAGVRSVDHNDLEVQWWAKDEDLRSSLHTPVADAEIEQAIIDAAIYDPRVAAFNITPEADNGWVTLRGTVDNLKAKTAAEMLASHTTGVEGVTNRIKVRPEILPTDENITNDILDVLDMNSITEAWEIDVHVNNGVATLTGVVDSYLEKSEAEWVISGIEGVNEVNNRLTVNYPYGYYWWGTYPYYQLFVSQTATEGTYPNDARIMENVSNQIWWSPFVDREQVAIYVDNGKVTLKGTVDSWREYRKASESAWEGGARSVSNQLVVK